MKCTICYVLVYSCSLLICCLDKMYFVHKNGLILHTIFCNTFSQNNILSIFFDSTVYLFFFFFEKLFSLGTEKSEVQVF